MYLSSSILLHTSGSHPHTSAIRQHSLPKLCQTECVVKLFILFFTDVTSCYSSTLGDRIEFHLLKCISRSKTAAPHSHVNIFPCLELSKAVVLRLTSLHTKSVQHQVIFFSSLKVKKLQELQPIRTYLMSSDALLLDICTFRPKNI